MNILNFFYRTKFLNKLETILGPKYFCKVNNRNKTVEILDFGIGKDKVIFGLVLSMSGNTLYLEEYNNKPSTSNTKSYGFYSDIYISVIEDIVKAIQATGNKSKLINFKGTLRSLNTKWIF